MTDPTGAPPSVVLSYLDRRGTPKRTVELEDASQPLEVAISDCNGDRRADVLVLDNHGEVEPGEVLVYLQERDRTFGVPLRFAVGVEPIRLIAARWDADSTLDLLTVNQGGQSVCVLPGRGDGTFGPALFTVHGVAGVGYADAGDLDQDGALDLALIHGSGGFLLFGSGDGSFGMPQPFSTDFSDKTVRVTDLTGDGFPDILRINCNGLGLRVLEGDGAGSFAPLFTFPGCFFGIGIGDLDGDGIVDLLLVSYDGITPLLGLGGGDFAPGASFSPGVGPIQDLALWDADHDHKLDLVFVVSVGESNDLSTDLTLLIGKGDGTFEGPGLYVTGPEGRALVVGDFVRDGVPDLAVLQYPPALSVLAGVGDGSFVASIDTPLRLGSVGLLDSADLDGNTLEDLIVGNGNSRGEEDELLLLSSTGAGTFDAPFRLPSGGLNSSSVSVADLDSDLLPDIVVSLLLSNQVAVHLGMPGGFAQPLSFGVGALPVYVEMDDVDGDGILDAVVADYGGDTASVLIGNGDGTFLPASATPTSEGPWGLEIGDFDGDGLDDLVVACLGDAATHSEVVLLFGMGDGTFTPPRSVPGVAPGVFQVIAADLNRDGLLDLVTTTEGELFVQIANGPANFEPRRTFTLSDNFGDMEISDLDADGKGDLVVVAGSRYLVFLNQGR